MSTRSKAAGIAGALLIAATSVGGVLASSHREAPLIAGDPAADNTDLYAFVSPNDPNSLTIIANYVPLEEPAGGPNFFPFDPAVRYEIHIDNNGDGKSDINYTFFFKTHRKATNFAGIPTFLYNDGPITSLTDPNLLVRQTYDVFRNGVRIARKSAQRPSRRPTSARVRRRTTRRWRQRRQDARQRDQALRRPARRRVLRRPRLDLRSGRPPPVQRPACHPAPGRAGRRRPQRIQHELDRHPGPAPAADQESRAADRPERPERRPRRLGRGQPAERPDAQRRTAPSQLRPVAAGLAPRQSADQRGDHPDRSRRTTGTARSPTTTRSSRSTTRRPRSPPSPTPCMTRWIPRTTTNRGDLVAILLTGLDIPSSATVPGGLHYTRTGSTLADELRVNTGIKPNAAGACVFGVAGGGHAQPAGRPRRRPVRLPERPSPPGRRRRHRAPRPRRGLRPDPPLRSWASRIAPPTTCSAMASTRTTCRS